MGKIRIERNVGIKYDQNLVDYWNIQNETFKNKCIEIGKPYGYSGMNVFYFFLLQYAMESKVGLDYKEFETK